MTARRTTTLAAATLASLFLALPAAANSWTAWEGQSEDAPRVIYSSDASVPGALFTCATDGKMKALIALTASDIPAVLTKNAPYRRGEDMAMTVGERATVNATVRLIPAIEAIELTGHALAAKLFNAAIRGDDVQISLKTAGDYTTSLPSPNDTFRAFARTCRESATSN